MVILLMVKLAVPVFDMVTVCAVLVVPTFWLVKVKLVGERLTWPERPVPVRAAVWGLLGALSVTLIEAVRVPEAAGVNVTLIGQEELTVTMLPQVLVWAKSPALVPVTAMLVMSKFVLPVLVRVIV